jgi:hypothetical protein
MIGGWKVWLLTAGLALAGAFRAEAASVRLGDLMGLSASQVQARLGGDAPAPTPGLAGLSGEISWQVVGLGEFGQSADREQSCGVSIPTDGRTVAAPLLVFKGGVLIAAARPAPMRDGPPPGPGTNIKAAMAYARSPLHDPLVSHPGELPLETDPADLAVLFGSAASPEDVVVRKCSPKFHAPPAGSGPRRFDSAGFFQGLSLLPFAVTLPATNAARARALVEGPQALAALHLGQVLDGGVQAFAARHRGVQVETRPDGYAILLIDMGAQPSNNLSRMDDAALVGVRAGRVVWIAPSLYRPPAYMISAGLCLGLDGRPTRQRRGCTDFGFFSP